MYSIHTLHTLPHTCYAGAQPFSRSTVGRSAGQVEVLVAGSGGDDALEELARLPSTVRTMSASLPVSLVTPSGRRSRAMPSAAESPARGTGARGVFERYQEERGLLPTAGVRLSSPSVNIAGLPTVVELQ